MRNLDFWPPPQEAVIPYHWTAEQAHAVVGFLEDLAEEIWSRYGAAIKRDCYPRPGPTGASVQLGLPFPPSWDDARRLEPGDDDISW